MDALKLPKTCVYSNVSKNTYRANLLCENDIKKLPKKKKSETTSEYIVQK